MTRNAVIGRYGEDVAVRYLQESGMTIVDRNWRCNYGEIDIVAREGSTFVACEVKTRSSMAFGHPAEAITDRKLRRMRHLVVRWLNAHAVHAPSVRVDVVTIVQQPSGRPVIEHLRGVDPGFGAW